MINYWPTKVSQKTIRLLNLWIEKRTCLGHRPPYVPQERKNHVFHVRCDEETGRSIIEIEILEGVCGIPGTLPPRWNDVEEFGMAFLDLGKEEQLVILAAEDPFEEFEKPGAWTQFLKDSRIYRQSLFEQQLEEAMVKLQHLCERRDLVKVMGRRGKELYGWKAIAAYLRRSLPVTLKMARNLGAPVTLIGGKPYTTEERLSEWFDEMVRRKPYWKRGR